jgi:sialic acid synthase SpsE
MRKLNKMAVRYPEIILGYSDHTLGHTAAILAVAHGARVIETHFTLDHLSKGPDHIFSKNPKDLNIWVKSIHIAYNMLGKSDLVPTAEEKIMRISARRTITAIRDIDAGETFTDDNIGMMRPGIGLTSASMGYFWNLKSARSIKSGEKLQRDDVQG